MTVLIRDYRNLPAAHCGSGAMRNLIYHYCGLELSEETTFGLGSGVDLLYIESNDGDPPVHVFGRSVTLEVDIALALGIDYREQPELDNDVAWERVRHEVVEGRPTMLSGDVFYLDYRDYKVHFPAHRFVLVGFDDARRRAFVADRIDPEPQACSYEALALSRNPPSAMSTHNLWGRFHGTKARRSIEEACVTALEKAARRMLGWDTTQAGLLRMAAGRSSLDVTVGLKGVERFLEHLPSWRQYEDWQHLTWYASQTFEKFGTGGGNFRKLYAGFLREAQSVVPQLVGQDLPERAAQSAALWTELSRHLENLSRGGEVDLWGRCTDTLSGILEVETKLFETLGANLGL